MTQEEALYVEIGNSMPDAEKSQMFGKPCFKISGKAFVCFFQNCMVFKLSGDSHKQALDMEGAKLFDPTGKGRAMKEWVQVPYVHHSKWLELAKAACEYVR